MRIKCKIELSYGSAKEAKAIASAVSVDDYEYVKTSLFGKKIIAEMEAEDAKTLMNTADDYLACVSVAERSAAGAKIRKN
ncbi:MAG: KEOPS complex subunit Pcc1 [Candidatus Thermoplasmatota archaeon]|nr:KEOPS complex subunit Pcc1 [Candidatus Thermoplasmatota archaeon]